MKVPSRWRPFVEACAAGIPPSGVIQARAEALLEDHRAGRERQLARSLPRRKAERAGRAAETGARRALRAAVFTRAGGRCECCGVEISSGSGELDHFLGRARSENIETTWALCGGPAGCHQKKTDNRPTRVFWLVRVRRHATLHGLGQALQLVQQQLALEPGVTR